ncbi:DUF4388 domain-containing protein [Desulfococcaceae bacterium OttesenSCG-928-F15]|nr:DUF4388 domain-containing protein [Desulfococcaceae bacterium OttesenSCG-928-F15]
MDGIFSGNIKGIGLSAFLQMVHMDRLSCTLIVEGNLSKGSIYVQDGEIIHAEYESFQPLEAVYEMIALRDPDISMETDVQRTKASIDKPMMQILMEGARRVDDRKDSEKPEKDKKSGEDDFGFYSEEDDEEFGDIPMELESQEPLNLPEDILGPNLEDPELDQEQSSSQESENFIPPNQEEAEVAQGAAVPPEKQELPAFLQQKPMPAPAIPVKPKAPKKPFPKKTFIFVTVLLAIGLSIGGLVFYLGFSANYQHETAYKKLLASLDHMPILEQQENVISQFMKSFPQSSYQSELLKKKKDIDTQILNRDYRELIAEEKTLSKDLAGIENALLLYDRFLGRHAKGPKADEIRIKRNQRISDMALALMEIKPEDMLMELWLKAIKEFGLRFPDSPDIPILEEEIRKRGDAIITDIASYSPQNDMERRYAIRRARNFLDNFTMHPEVNHVREMLRQLLVAERVATLFAKGAALNDLNEEILFYEREKRMELDESVRKELQKKISEIYARIDMERKWSQLQRELQRPALTANTRILLLEQYLVQSPPPEYAREARQMLTEIQKAAGRKPTPPPAQEQLTAIPPPGETRPPTPTEVQTAKIRLERALSETRGLLKPVAARFEDLNDGTFKDLRTGQIWMLADSEAYTGQCLGYEDAKTFVEYLSLGGNHDWRLPTGSELAVLFKNPPFFPTSTPERWYWTSDIFVRGYRNEIQVVTAKPETVFERQHKTLNDCGYILAIRP